MLRKRVIPIVLLDGFSVLKTINFNVRRNLGSPVTVARTYNTRNVDELVLLDIDASKQGRSLDAFTIRDVAAELFMPLTVGGGIRSVDDVRLALKMGADKVSINTEALKNPEIIKDASEIFGCQCIVSSIDFMNVDGHYKIYSNGRILEDRVLLDWCKKVEELGAGEILLNNVSLDGMMTGADLEIADKIADNVRIPVIYAGGVSSAENAAELAATNVSAVAASSIFHFTSITPLDCKLEMDKKGIPVRL